MVQAKFHSFSPDHRGLQHLFREYCQQKKQKRFVFFTFFDCFVHSYFSVLIYTVVYFVLFIKNRSLMYKAHKFGNTSGVSKSSTDWLNSQGFLWETCVLNSLKVHLETRRDAKPPCDSPSGGSTRVVMRDRKSVV